MYVCMYVCMYVKRMLQSNAHAAPRYILSYRERTQDNLRKQREQSQRQITAGWQAPRDRIDVQSPS